jgi:UDP-N-acetyl-D-glucosamine dehydrogenase
MFFYLGPGLGGHCIPIDPLYLSWKLRTVNYTARFIELASAINSNMPNHVVQKVADMLNGARRSINGSKILLLGVAYKKNVSDVRESPALDILGLLKAKGADVSYADPFVPEMEFLGETMHAHSLGDGIAHFDCVVVLTNHDAFDFAQVAREAALVFDARNAMAGIQKPASCTVVTL